MKQLEMRENQTCISKMLGDERWGSNRLAYPPFLRPMLPADRGECRIFEWYTVSLFQNSTGHGSSMARSETCLQPVVKI